MFDSFELSQNIASGCAFLSNQEYMKCSVDIPEFGYSLFLDYGMCEMVTPSALDLVCYDVPSFETKVFSS